MVNHNAIKGVLHNFLGTYTSRYSDYEGYWLFGILICDVKALRIDLLNPSVGATASASVAAATQLASQKFREQMQKAGFGTPNAREAMLCIQRLSDARSELVNGRVCAGNTVRFVATVVSDSGKKYGRELAVFVAPHDPKIERRSTRQHLAGSPSSPPRVG
jgi:hypothetical protein